MANVRVLIGAMMHTDAIQIEFDVAPDAWVVARRSKADATPKRRASHGASPCGVRSPCDYTVGTVCPSCDLAFS